MSATQTKQKTDRMKLMPVALALDKASQAVQIAAKPSTHRAVRGTVCHAPGPTFRARAPPRTHTPNASHHARLGPTRTQPAHKASPQAAATAKPMITAAADEAELSRAHSHAAAPAINSISNANGQGAEAKSA